MAKLTVSSIKKQIAALEAKAARLAQEATKASVDKVRALMKDLGVTLEDLTPGKTRGGSKAKRAPSTKGPIAKRAGAGVVKYRDPATGATWTGIGRAPGWIANAKNRDDFLVTRGDTAVKTAPTKRGPAAKKAAAEPSGPKRPARDKTERASPAAKRGALGGNQSKKRRAEAAKPPAGKKPRARKAPSGANAQPASSGAEVQAAADAT